MLDVGLFYFFAGLAVISAILVVTRRNAVHSAIFLVTALLATAGIFLQLHAEFLFIVQVILYVGGIMVLFIFVIMLVNLDVSVRQMRFNRMWVVGLLLALALGRAGLHGVSVRAKWRRFIFYDDAAGRVATGAEYGTCGPRAVFGLHAAV